MSAQAQKPSSSRRQGPPKKQQTSSDASGGGCEPRAAADLDDKARSALKAALTTASDALLVDEQGREHALPVDRAVAFIEMGAYVKAKASLDEALETLGKPKMRNRFPKAVATIEETARELPVEDAAFEVEKPDPGDADEVAKFDQVPNSTECTVTIPVPPATAAADVTVVIKRDFLSCAVKGHAKQPHVVFGCLRGNVEVSACAWTLDGDGEDRALVVNLEKESSHPCWKKLMGDPIDYWAEDADLEAMGKLNVGDDAVWTTREEAAKIVDATPLPAE